MTHNNNRNHVSMKQLSLAIALSLTTALSFAQGGGPGFGGPQGGPGMGGPGMGGPGMGRPGGPGMMGMGPGMGLPPVAMLVNIPEVQREINMTNAQWEKVTEIMEANRPQGGPGFGGQGQGGRQGQGQGRQGQGRQGQGGQRQGGPGQGGPGNFDPEAMQQQREAIDRKVLAVFNQSQGQRLRQIQIQMAGGGALLDARVQRELSLSQDQVTKLRAIADELRPPRPDFQGGGQGRQGQGRQGQGQGRQGGGQGRQGHGGPGHGGPGMGGPGMGGPGMNPEQRKENDAKFLAVLTDGQRSKFKAMQGKPFEFRGPGGRQG